MIYKNIKWNYINENNKKIYQHENHDIQIIESSYPNDINIHTMDEMMDIIRKISEEENE